MTGRPPPYKKFFAPLAALSPADNEKVHCAYIFSKHGHEGEIRDDGSRYFDHPKGSAWIYINELGGRHVRTIIDILLHDLQEQSYLLSPFRLRLNFGKKIGNDLLALTKLAKGKETTKGYLARIIERGAPAIIAKICDRLHNMRTLKACSARKQKHVLEETRKYHIPILFPALSACGPEHKEIAALLLKKLEKAMAAL